MNVSRYSPARPVTTKAPTAAELGASTVTPSDKAKSGAMDLASIRRYLEGLKLPPMPADHGS